MGFMRSYKHLDHLCAGIYPNARNGISGYIEDMEHNPDGTYLVSGWNDDYKALKHYRWVRNQIAHDEYADEENMCQPGDIEWLENFHRRIMNQTDPLALARMAKKAPVSQQKIRPKTSAEPHTDHRYPVEKKADLSVIWTIIALTAVFTAVLYFLLNN